jgi:hypothetical protein
MKVLIAHDGSERSDAALEDLRHAGLGSGIEAEVIHVAEVWIPPEDSYTGPSVWESYFQQAFEISRQYNLFPRGCSYVGDD